MMKHLSFASLIALATLTGCSDSNQETPSDNPMDDYQISRDEVYAGGKLGTTFSQTHNAYQDLTPAVEQAGLESEFQKGEYFFDRRFTEYNKPVSGLGPVYVRSACIDCHPGYGHGKRMNRYRAGDPGNGYLLVITDENDNYLTSLTGMPQTKAVHPFKAPVDENKIRIEWLSFTDEWGNAFPDGEKYDLIYPEVSIPEDAYYVPLKVGNRMLSHAQVRVRLESTIGIYGSGLLDAIPADSLKAQYRREELAGAKLNPAIFKNGEWVKTYQNKGIPLRFTYGLTRGTLQDGPGSNAIWNITNVTRSNRRSHYITEDYAQRSSTDPDVQAGFYRKFPEMKVSGDVQKDIYNYLMSKSLEPELSDEDFVNFMVWHRGLAVPAARGLDDAQVKLGHKLFRQIGCTACHRPSWKTGDDRIVDPNGFFTAEDERLPRYPHQTIWPYSDMVQHRLAMVNDIRTGWCRTTPLWGRGLSLICTGAADRMHDCRARNVMEAIMWHGMPDSDARWTIEKFRKLTKQERDAVVKFIEAI